MNTQGNKRVDYGYNALGQVTSKKRYSDITGTNLVAETNQTYDQIDRLTGITHSKGANTIASYVQTYDSNSRITGITNKDGTAAYNYDNTDQLTGVDYSIQTDENYTYDNNGNRTNTGYVTGVNNRLQEDPKYRYEYDLVGNRTKRVDKTTNEVTEYAWDIRDRLVGITAKNGSGAVIKSASYKYDVYNERIAKTVDPDGAGALPATTERYVYGTNQNIALEFDGNNNLTHRYLFGNGIDQIEADESNGAVLWGLADHLGSVRDVIDNSGTVKNHISYDSFGNITAQTDSSVVFRYGYTGREFDKESGLYYYRSRPYDPIVGRFIQEDKIGFGGGDSNLSRYVRNRPTGLRDSRGFEGEDLGAAFGDYSAGSDVGSAYSDYTGYDVGSAYGNYSAGYDVGSAYGDYSAGYDVGSAYPGGSYGDGTSSVVGGNCGNSTIFSNPNYDYQNLDYGFGVPIYNFGDVPGVLITQADIGVDLGKFLVDTALFAGAVVVTVADGIIRYSFRDRPSQEPPAPVGGGFQDGTSPAKNIPTGFPIYQPGKDTTFLSIPLNSPNLGGNILTSPTGSSLALPPYLTIGGIDPVNKGIEGVIKATKQLLSEGIKIVGQEVTVKTTGGKTRIDLVGQDASGNRVLVEVKNGPTAKLNQNQKVRFGEIQIGGFTPVGKNAGRAGFTPKQPEPKTTVRVLYF